MPVDTHWLESRATKGVVLAERDCASCGYNLQGLSREGLCPECGLPIAQTLHPSRASQSGMRHWPGWILRTLRIGFLLSGLGWFTLTAAWFFSRYAAPSLSDTWSNVGHLAHTLGAMLYLVGIAMTMNISTPVTGRAGTSGIPMRDEAQRFDLALGVVATATQSAWLVTSGATYLAGVLTGGSAKMAFVTALVAACVAIAGLPLVVVRISRLQGVPSNENDAEESSRVAWFIAPIGLVLLLHSAGVMPVPIVGIVAFMSPAFLLAALWVVWSFGCVHVVHAHIAHASLNAQHNDEIERRDFRAMAEAARRAAQEEPHVR